MIRPTRLLLMLLALGGLWPNPARADGDDYKKIQYFRGIKASYAITSEVKADVDGDGVDEVLICYREPDRALNQQGGVLVLSGDKVAWHALFEGMYPEGVEVAGRSLTFSLVQIDAGGEKKHKKSLELGKDFFFRDDEQSPFYGVKIRASSTLKSGGVEASMVFDGDLKTAWAEGAEGTGVDESITLSFAKPVQLGLMGVLHGNFSGRRPWIENNRLHRAEATVETSSDRFDVDSDMDFEKDLGLGLYGDTVELSFSNKPIMRYFKVGKRNVTSLELKITSVLLGEKNDDAYVAEIDLTELIPKAVLLGKVKARPEGEKSEKADSQANEPAADWVDEDDF